MSEPSFTDLSPGVVLEGPILPEPVEVLAVVPMGASVKLIGKGLRTGQVRDPILDAAQLAQLTLTPKRTAVDAEAAPAMQLAAGQQSDHGTRHGR